MVRVLCTMARAAHCKQCKQKKRREEEEGTQSRTTFTCGPRGHTKNNRSNGRTPGGCRQDPGGMSAGPRNYERGQDPGKMSMGTNEYGQNTFHNARGCCIEIDMHTTKERLLQLHSLFKLVATAQCFSAATSSHVLDEAACYRSEHNPQGTHIYARHCTQSM